MVSLIVNFAFVSTWISTRREINDSVSSLQALNKVMEAQVQKSLSDAKLADATFNILKSIRGNVDALDKNYVELKGFQTWMVNAITALDKKVGDETPPATKRRR